MRRRLHILVANATGPTNIGDQAMLMSLVKLIRESYRDSIITIHSSEHHLYTDKFFDKVDYTLYSWTVFSNTDIFVRVLKLIDLFIKYLAVILGVTPYFGYRKTNELLADYKRADVIFFVGGGYLRANKGFTQILNALMQVLMIEFAKLFKAPKIVAPISFGPYAYKWLEKVSVNSLKPLDCVSVREKISYDRLRNKGVKNLILSTDHALLLDGVDKSYNGHFTLGFTIRKWLEAEKQRKFEKYYFLALRKFAKRHDVLVQPIIQVDCPQYGDHDYQLTADLSRELRKSQVKVNPIARPKTLEAAIDFYGKINMCLGMRMHSNILSAISNTPFLAIAYEHKTEGICLDLNMANYLIRCELVNESNLYQLLEQLYRNFNDKKEDLKHSLEKLRERETAVWRTIIRNTISTVLTA